MNAATTVTRISIATVLVVLTAVLTSTLAIAQDVAKPKPISIVVSFAPGSTTDTVARSIAQKLSESTGAVVVVENKPGAGGNIATGFVKRAPADGHTILAHSVAFAVNPSLYANAGYDALKDFVPLALGGRTPNIITVNPATPAKPERIDRTGPQAAFELRIIWDRHHHASVDRTFEDRCEDRYRPRPVSAGRSDCRSRRQSDADGVHFNAAGRAANQGWQVARHCGHQRQAQRVVARRAIGNGVWL